MKKQFQTIALRSDALEQYLSELFPDSQTPFADLRQQGIDEHIPIISAHTVSFLKFLITIKQPQSILEIGAAIGYSSLCFDLWSPPTTEIATIEISTDNIKRLTKNHQQFARRPITVYEGDARTHLPQLAKEGKTYDFIFVDAQKAEYHHYLNAITPLLRRTGMIVFDNMLFKGWVCAPADCRPDKLSIPILDQVTRQLLLDHSLVASLIPLGDGLVVATPQTGSLTTVRPKN